MKNKKPETIADLKINLVFEKKFIRYETFITNFIFDNYNLKNYEIKLDTYIFKIKIRNKNISFKIYVSENSPYENRLNNLMFQLYSEIGLYLFDNNIYDVLGSIKFETKDSKTFIIKYKILPF